MAETEVHRLNLTDTIDMLQRRYEPDPNAYVSGNMFVYYAEGNPRQNLAPDVFAVFGVPRRLRDCYKVWEEPKHNLDLVIEYTSKSTKREDLQHKFEIYRDRLRVREYVLFDPYEEYLDPSMRMYRLVNGIYVPVAPIDGRLPSEVLGLHLERDGYWLKFRDPRTGERLLTEREARRLEEDLRRQAEKLQRQTEKLKRQEEKLRHEAERLRQQAEQERDQFAARLLSVESEVERLRRELEFLRSGPAEQE